MSTPLILLGLALWLILSMLVFAMLDICAMLRQPPLRIRLVDEHGNEIPMVSDGPLHYDEIDQLADRYFRELEEAEQASNIAAEGV